MSAGESKKAVFAALAANAGIAVAKFAGFLITRSGSMLAEAAHSLADSGNQGLLLFGDRRAGKRADAEHPFGHERERYFAAFVVAIVLFTAGGAFAIREAFHKLEHPDPLSAPLVAIVILVVGLGLEGWSFRTAVRAASPLREGRSWWRFVREGKTAELTVVLMEDSAALVGLTLAMGGVGLAWITGDPTWDAYGTLAIGVLLGAVAIVLGIETKSLLIGEAVSAEDQAKIRAALVATPEFRGVVHLRTEHRGPQEALVAAKVDVAPDLESAALAAAIDDAERRIRAAVPEARYIFIEPDQRRDPGPSRDPA